MVTDANPRICAWMKCKDAPSIWTSRTQCTVKFGAQEADAAIRQEAYNATSFAGAV
jgi:hypothetical protein